MKCPGIEQVMDYIDGRLEGQEAQSLAEHFASGCAECAENRQWLQNVRSVAARDECLDPPPWVLKRVLNLFEQSRRRTDNRPGRAVASLVFDSLSHSLLSEVRLAATANRHLLYSAGRYSIDLQVSASDPSHADLMGQVLREDEGGFASVSGVSIELGRGSQPAYTTTADEFGAFLLKGVIPGDYDLAIEAGAEGVIVPNVPVKKEGMKDEGEIKKG